MQRPVICRVAVIGAGISGVVSCAHLLRSGLEVTVFERNKEPGGIWLHDNEVAIEAQYPCMTPSDAERLVNDDRNGKERQRLLHAPPGPCYDNLTNNISTPLLETTLNAWPKGTPHYVKHGVIKEYIQETSRKVGVDEATIFGALVTKVWKEGSAWMINWTVLDEDRQTGEFVETHNTSAFDAVVIASGHYHTPRIPNIPGLAEAKSRWPLRVMHSKSFRNASGFQGKNVLLMGGGVSSTDIAKDISHEAQLIYQSTRNGLLDMPASVLPKNASRVSEVVAIETTTPEESSSSNPPFALHLRSGQTLHDIDNIIICTGYQMTLPFFPQYNNNSVPATAADDSVLVTDGGQAHNLHRDIFYIPDPTLAFVGIPQFNATFTLFEFQAIAIAAFFSGVVQLPSTQTQREEYEHRVKTRGYGRLFHSLKDEEESYVKYIVQWVNAGRAKRGLSLIEGHSATWIKEKQWIYQEIAKLRALKAAEQNRMREQTALVV